MFLLVIILYQIIMSSTKLINYTRDKEFESDNGIYAPENHQSDEKHFETWDDTLWVLKLNEKKLNLTYLRSATETEEEYFDEEIGTMIHRHPVAYLRYKERQQIKRVKKDDPEKSYPFDQIFNYFRLNDNKAIYESNNEAKRKVIQMMNKFVLSFQKEPDTNLPEGKEAYDIPTLTLYFKGPFTVLLVNYERMVWQFFIKPPSPLPEWLYNEHTNVILAKKGMYVMIPETVTEELYGKLLNLLEKLFRYPI